MNYHIARDGQQIGVFSREEVLARLSRGEIRATDLAWSEGMTDWKPVSEVFGTGAAPAPAPVQPAPMPTTLRPSPVASTISAGVAPPQKPANYLIPAILATVFCCQLTGIAAIIFAAQVDGKYAKGDYVGAETAAKNAKIWTFVSVGVWAVIAVGYVAFMIIMTMTAGASSY